MKRGILCLIHTSTFPPHIFHHRFMIYYYWFSGKLFWGNEFLGHFHTTQRRKSETEHFFLTRKMFEVNAPRLVCSISTSPLINTARPEKSPIIVANLMMNNNRMLFKLNQTKQIQTVTYFARAPNNVYIIWFPICSRNRFVTRHPFINVCSISELLLIFGR